MLLLYVKMAEKVITRGVPEGTLRIGVVVGHRHISLVLATMSTLVVGVKVVHTLVIVSDLYTCNMRTNRFLLRFISHQLVRHWANNWSLLDCDKLSLLLIIRAVAVAPVVII